MDWDDLKVVLVLSRSGSAKGAARLLNVSKSTISRRLDEMERKLHTRLFERMPDGYRLTRAGDEILPTALQVEKLVLEAERRVSGDDEELGGRLRLTVPPFTRSMFLIEPLVGFLKSHPEVELELVTSSDFQDLNRREADVALRILPANTSPSEHLIGKCISPLSASTYVHRSLLKTENHGDVSHLSWIGRNPMDRKQGWLVKSGYQHNPVRHSILDTNLLLDAMRAGLGMAYMLCFAAQHDPDIVRVPGARIVHNSDLWLLAHRDMRNSARLRAARELISSAFASVADQMDTRPAAAERRA